MFTALAELGEAGYHTAIEHQAELGDLIRERLVSAGWRIVNDPPLPVVCFTGPALDSGRATPAEVAARVHAERVWISVVNLSGREPALRACVTSFRATEKDVGALITALEEFK